MKKLSLLFTTLVCASALAFAVDSEYCGFSSVDTQRDGITVTLTWETLANGDVQITLGSGEGANTCAFRNGGFEGGIDAFEVSVDGFVTATAASNYFTAEKVYSGNTFTLVKIAGVELSANAQIKHVGTGHALAWKANGKDYYSFPDFVYTYGGVCAEEPVVSKIALDAATFAKAGESVALTAQAYDQFGKPMEAEVTYEVNPADAGAVKDGVFTPVKLGAATITAKAGDKEASVLVYCVPSDNLAEGKPAEAGYNTENPAEQASAANDGNENSSWVTWANRPAEEEWWIVDLEAKYDVTGIDVLWGDDYSTEYILQARVDEPEEADKADDSKWETIAQVKDAQANKSTYSNVTGAEARYIRLHSLQKSNVQCIRLRELRVFGTEWAPKDDEVKPVLTKAELVSKNDHEAVLAVEATDNYLAKIFHIVDEANELDITLTAFDGQVTLSNLNPGTDYTLTITAVDMSENESENSIEVKFTTDKQLKLKLTPTSTICSLGEAIDITVETLDEYDLSEDSPVQFVVTPTEAGEVKDGKFIPAQTGLASIFAMTDKVQSESIDLFCYAGENVALGMAVEASGYDTLNNLLPQNAVDGNEGSQWSARQGETGTEREYDAWLTVDLGNFYDIEMIAIRWEGACSKQYTVDFSIDNENWRTAYYAGWDKVETHWEYLYGTTEDAKKVRYVRVWSAEAVSQYGIKIMELQVIATEWVPTDDTEKPVLVKAELVSKTDNEAVIAVEATDNYAVKQFRVVEEAHEIDLKMAAEEGMLTLTDLAFGTAYQFAITAVDLVGLESDAQIVEFSTDRLKKLSLTVTPTIGKVGDELALEVEALEEYDLNQDGEIRYTVVPAEAGTVKDGKFVFAMPGNATLVAETDRVFSDSVAVFCYEGKNVAYKIKAEASGYDEEANLLPANAVDGDEATLWSAFNGETDDERIYDAWIVADLGDVYDIEMLAIKWEGACSKKYHVDFSEDNENWRTAYEAGWDKVETHWEYLFGTAVDSKNVRYVRVWSTEAVSQYGIKIWEMKVYAPTDKDPEHPDKPAPAPAPELGEENAVAVFCDVIAGGPQITIGEWGQSTVAELLELEEGDEAYYLSNTNYCGWEFSPAVNASEMNTLHVDLYSTTMSSISLTPISEGPKEGSYTVTLKANEWNSVDIPLSAFAAAGIAWDNIIQFKFMNATPDGSTLYIDNVYFYSDPQSTVEVSIEPSEGRSQKMFRNGQIMIVRGGSVYSILGQTVQ